MLVSMLTLFGFSLAIGLVQAISPDRWLPLSVHSWQKNWPESKVRALSAFLSLIHVFLGVLLALVVLPFLQGQPQEFLLRVFSMMVLVAAVGRLFRLGRLREVVGSGLQGRWGVYALASLMGPCEIALPLFVKTGLSFPAMSVAALGLLAGTFVGVYLLTRGSRSLWSMPARFAQVLNWTQGRGAWVPSLALPLLILLLISTA
jgi:hypothetical protein